MKIKKETPKTISTEEAMGIIVDNELGTVTKATIITWIKNKKLGKKVGGRWRILEDKFLDFLGVGDKY